MLHRFIFLALLCCLHSSSSFLNRSRRQANGCGPSNLNIDTFLTEIGDNVLIVCCNEHDLCYDKCDKKQLTCDNTFLNCMIQACQLLLLPANVDRCQNNARMLFLFVFFGGQSAYQQAQQQHQCNISKQ